MEPDETVIDVKSRKTYRSMEIDYSDGTKLPIKDALNLELKSSVPSPSIYPAEILEEQNICKKVWYSIKFIFKKLFLFHCK